MSRPGWDEWFLDGTRWLSRRGDCTRRKVGALVVNPEHRIVGAGYNGSFPGGPSCLAGDCPRGQHYEVPKRKHWWGDVCDEACHDTECRGCVHVDWDTWGAACPDSKCVECGEKWPCATSKGLCGCGNAWPCPDAVAPGSAYDTGPGACINTHAEENAKSDAMRHSGGDLDGCTLYVSCQPCEGCIRSIRNTTHIKAIIWPTGAIGLP
jgi:deoxycytidylate deaminase